MKYPKTGAALVAAFGCLLAQGPQDTNQAARAPTDEHPVYLFTATERTTKAINYNHRAGATKVDFRGTELLPQARGEAKVESKQGYIEVEVEFDDLKPATALGGEYLTYVLWAVSPDGRTANLGEVLLNGTRARLNVTTDLQSFALLVTAEPYYAVRRPSDLVVLENVPRTDTKGKVEVVDTKFELLQRGQYKRFSNPLGLEFDRKLPLELYEARNAVQIARASGADRFAIGTFEKAEKSLAAAEASQVRKADKKTVIMSAREAVQTAEDARAIAVRRQDDDALAARRQRSAERTATAEIDRDAARSETERVKRDAETAAIRAEDRAASAQLASERARRESDSRTNAAEAETDRVRRDRDTQVRAARAEADRANRDSEANKLALEKERPSPPADQSRIEAGQAELRSKLLSQFNAVLPARDTPRGLIVSLQDSLFDPGKQSLSPLGRENMAKVSGVVSAYPGLMFAVEGHTGAKDSEDQSPEISEQRADSVRDYLTQSGILSASITSKGFGETRPLVSNETPEGRKQNRRVEVVVSGDSIGTMVGQPVAVR